MTRLGRTHDRRPEGDRGALQTETHAQRGDAALGRLAHERRRAARDLRPAGAGRDHDAIGARIERGAERGIIREIGRAHV